METGFYIGSDKMFHCPSGRTGWSLFRPDVETVWGRNGDTGFLLLDAIALYGPGGLETSYYVIEEGGRRVIHGPEAACLGIPGVAGRSL